MANRTLMLVLAFAAVQIFVAPEALALHSGGTTSKSSGSLFGSRLEWTGQPDEVMVEILGGGSLSDPAVDIEQSTRTGQTVACTLIVPLSASCTNTEDPTCPTIDYHGRCEVDIISTNFQVESCTKESGGVNASFIPLVQKCGTGADTTGSITLRDGFQAVHSYLDGQDHDRTNDVIALGSVLGLTNGQCGSVFPKTAAFRQKVMGQTSLYYAGDKNCGGTATPVDRPIEQRVCADAEDGSGMPTDCASQLAGTVKVGTATAIQFTEFLADSNPNSINTTCTNEGDVWTFAAGSNDLNVRDIDFETWRAEGIAGDPDNPGVAPNRVGTPPDDVPQCEVGQFLGDAHEDARCRIPTCGTPKLASLLRGKDSDGDNLVDMLITFRSKGVTTKQGKLGIGNFAGTVQIQLTPTQ